MLKTFFITGLLILISPQTARAISPEALFKDRDNYWTNQKQQKIRKGTIGATLANIKLINNTKLSSAQYLEVAQVLASLVPSLEALDIFEHFPLEYWLSGKRKGQIIEGHLLLGILQASHSGKILCPKEKEALLKNIASCHQVLRKLAEAVIKEKTLNLEPVIAPKTAITPEKLLQDGQDSEILSFTSNNKIKIRKGSLKALLVNVEIIEQCQKNPHPKLKNQALAEIKNLLEAAYHLNFLQLYEIDDYSIFASGKYGSAYKMLEETFKTYLAKKDSPQKNAHFFSKMISFIGDLKAKIFG